MSYKLHIEIKELNIAIPEDCFPLKSDVIVGKSNPVLMLQEDECSFYPAVYATDLGQRKYFKLEDENVIDTNGWFGELEGLTEKYKGTLLADCVGEDGEVEYVRIRDGVRKTIKIVEED